MQVCTLLYSLGSEVEQIVKTFVYASAREVNKYEAEEEKVDSYFVPKVNIIHERARFHQRVQKHRESAEECIRSLRERPRGVISEM